LGRMSKHVPDIRVIIPGTSLAVAMTRIRTENLSYADIWWLWTIRVIMIYRDIPIPRYTARKLQAGYNCYCGPRKVTNPLADVVSSDNEWSLREGELLQQSTVDSKMSTNTK
jgi:hypothetical protein